MPSFPPLLGTKPHTLILGSMPSRKSLEIGQYYAHPRNCFWWIMCQLLKVDPTADYSTRTCALQQAGFGVWDVLLNCERKGSLDSAIVRASEQVNDLPALLATEQALQLIAFNGGAAEAIFMRHCGHVLGLESSINTVRLPSTSPAHARLDKYAKLSLWRELLRIH